VAQQATDALALARAVRDMLRGEAERMQHEFGSQGRTVPNRRILACAGDILELLKEYELDIADCRRTLRVCEELAELGSEQR